MVRSSQPGASSRRNVVISGVAVNGPFALVEDPEPVIAALREFLSAGGGEE